MDEAKRKLIRENWFARGDRSKAQFVTDMVKAGFQKRTIYRVIKNIQNGLDVSRKPGSGRKKTAWTQEKERQLCHEADHTVGISFRMLSRKYKIHDKTVKKVLEKNGIKMYHRKKVPRVDRNQEKRQKTRIRGLTRSLFKASNDPIHVIMDDESYFDGNGLNFYGSRTFLSSQPDSEPNSIKFRTESKYPFKYMVWIAISPKGRSTYFIKESKGAVNSELYIRECLEKRLIPFIEKHYPDGNYIFWPDLASSHNSKATQDFMTARGIKFVPKELNPPNVPNLRSIENFWHEIKQRVFADGFQPKDEKELLLRLRKVLKKVGKSVCERYMMGVTKTVRAADTKGVLFNI